MIRPVFAKGKEQEQALSQAAPASANQLYTPSASANFSVGDLIFIAEADGSELEFLGPVIAVAPTFLTTTLWLGEGKSETAVLWRAAESFSWPVEPAFPLEKEFASGIKAARSLDGTVYSARLAEPRRTDRLSARIRRSDFDDLRQWIDANLNGGLDDFSYVDERGGVAKGRLISPSITQKQDDEGLVDFELDIAVIAEGVFV
jgi:hypothetical protein